MKIFDIETHANTDFVFLNILEYLPSFPSPYTHTFLKHTHTDYSTTPTHQVLSKFRRARCVTLSKSDN